MIFFQNMVIDIATYQNILCSNPLLIASTYQQQIINLSIQNQVMQNQL